MKSLAVAVMLLAVSSLAAAADKRSSAPSDSLRAELLAARETVWKAWFDNDQEALRRLLPEELVAINNGEQQWQGLKETLDSAVQFKAGGSKLISLKFEKTEIQVYGDVAVLYSIFALETEEKGKRIKTSGRATEIFQKRKVWVNTGWHLDSGS